MSRTSQFEKKTNPAQLTIEWAGASDAGHFKTYDKEAKTNIALQPFSFAVLGERNCVRGWYEEKHSNAFSNEVGSLKNQDLTVRYFEDGKSKELCHGKYEDLKGTLASQGIKYHKVIYVLITDSPDVESGTVAKILLKGAAAGAWFDVGNKQGQLTVGEAQDGKKGAVRYKTPTFEVGELSQEDAEEAELAYEQVKAYFDTAPTTVREPAPSDEEEDDLPF